MDVHLLSTQPLLAKANQGAKRGWGMCQRDWASRVSYLISYFSQLLKTFWVRLSLSIFILKWDIHNRALELAMHIKVARNNLRIFPLICVSFQKKFDSEQKKLKGCWKASSWLLFVAIREANPKHGSLVLLQYSSIFTQLDFLV